VEELSLIYLIAFADTDGNGEITSYPENEGSIFTDYASIPVTVGTSYKIIVGSVFFGGPFTISCTYVGGT
jgi:hypothetical protein